MSEKREKLTYENGICKFCYKTKENIEKEFIQNNIDSLLKLRTRLRYYYEPDEPCIKEIDKLRFELQKIIG